MSTASERRASDAGTPLIKIEQTSYEAQPSHEMLPERDPIIRHLGGKALSFTAQRGRVDNDTVAPDDLPSIQRLPHSQVPRSAGRTPRPA